MEHSSITSIANRSNIELRQKYCYPGGGVKGGLKDTLCQKWGYPGRNG